MSRSRGNLLRADDGVGIHAVERLREERPEVEAIDVSTSRIGTLEHIRGCGRVVIVDAIITGAEPGTIHKIRPRNLGSEEFRSHGLSLSTTFQLGSQLYPDEMPERLVILAVEAEDITSYSTELTAKVRAAIPRLMEEICKELDESKV
jgi:hydrogenase maturation protease